MIYAGDLHVAKCSRIRGNGVQWTVHSFTSDAQDCGKSTGDSEPRFRTWCSNSPGGQGSAFKAQPVVISLVENSNLGIGYILLHF